MQLPELPDLTPLTRFRHDLHRHPDLSGQESPTAARVQAFLMQLQPDQLLTELGGAGIAAVFHGKNPDGPVVLFRAELDALPIQESSDISHQSSRQGVAHLCGHDGHMAMLSGLGSLLHRQRLPRGKVVLLYQPAEETGAGAWDVLQESQFRSLRPDYVFALHNLPGFPLHQVVVRQEVFAAASTGFVVEFFGKASHAAEPENGVNPGVAMAELLLAYQEIIQNKTQFQDLTLLTVIHARLGEVAFGTNPGFGTVMATLRSYQPTDLRRLKQLVQEAAERIADRHQLRLETRWVEEFPATINHPEAVELVRHAAAALELEVTEAPVPFRWSEDFGHFTQQYKGAFFGLGSGVSQPQLHHTDFDFPDELIPTGAALFYRIAATILNA